MVQAYNIPIAVYDFVNNNVSLQYDLSALFEFSYNIKMHRKIFQNISRDQKSVLIN